MKYHDLVELQEEIARLFREARGWEQSPPAGPQLEPPTDIVVGAEAYYVRLDLPGVERERLRIRAEDGIISINGKKEQTAISPGARMLRGEREYGSFSRTVALPSDADLNDTRAALAEGVLELRVARKQRSQARRIEIEVA